MPHCRYRCGSRDIRRRPGLAITAAGACGNHVDYADRATLAAAMVQNPETLGRSRDSPSQVSMVFNGGADLTVAPAAEAVDSAEVTAAAARIAEAACQAGRRLSPYLHAIKDSVTPLWASFHSR